MRKNMLFLVDEKSQMAMPLSNIKVKIENEDDAMSVLVPIVEMLATQLILSKQTLAVAEERDGEFKPWYRVRYAYWMFGEEAENFTDEDREHPFCYTTLENEKHIMQYIKENGIRGKS